MLSINLSWIGYVVFYFKRVKLMWLYIIIYICNDRYEKMWSIYTELLGVA